ncbi:hypothetical protein PR202_gb26656 [Eleusine coracana subsp. coracana]|uniref:RING-type E3 ubiquitin transferase n=1 Tax=Eleusine coracana subsp. coracana TaxID=191504 RepID=A0AAV5FRP9_ELECO|nr:hypothetical protein PR202_gb26656 [Eleusine coracana subsp. coracana]
MGSPSLLLAVLLLSFLNHGSYLATASYDEDFFKSCPPHRCNKEGPEIRFPFRLSTQSSYCGVPGMELSCFGNDTILNHPVLGACKVTLIYYRRRFMNVIPLEETLAHCQIQKFISKNLSTNVYSPQTIGAAILLGCSSDSISTNQYGIVGPISCFGINNKARRFMYLVPPYTYISVLPLDCVVISKGIPMPYTFNKYGLSAFNIPNIREMENRMINGETAFTWYASNITSVCQRCENEGRHCGFSSQRGQAFCQHNGSHVIIIAGG